MILARVVLAEHIHRNAHRAAWKTSLATNALAQGQIRYGPQLLQWSCWHEESCTMKPSPRFIAGMFLFLLGCGGEKATNNSLSPNPKYNAALQEYIRDLSSPDVEKRRTAVRVLGASASYAETALPQLIELLND